MLKENKARQSTEDYLEVILVLKNRLVNVRSIDIVNELNFSKPSVSIAMKKCRNEGYITVDEDGFITLTPTGFEIATSVYNRHKTILIFLQHLGVSKETAEMDACRLEHIISSESFQCIQYFLESNSN